MRVKRSGGDHNIIATTSRTKYQRQSSSLPPVAVLITPTKSIFFLALLLAFTSRGTIITGVDALSLPGRKILLRSRQPSVIAGNTDENNIITRRDDLRQIEIIESLDKLPTTTTTTTRRRRIFRGLVRKKGRRRKSLSKTLFPLEEEEEGGDDDQLGVTQENLNGLSPTTNNSQEGDIIISQDVQKEEEEEVVLLDDGGLLPTPTTFTKTIKKPPTRLIPKLRKKEPLAIVSNIEELREAILDKGLELRDVELKYSPPPSLLSSMKRQEEQLLTDVDVVSAGGEADSEEEEERVQDMYLMTNELNPNYFMATSYLPPPNVDIELDEDDEHNNGPNADEWQLIGNVLAEDFPGSSYDECNTLPDEYDDKTNKGNNKLIFSHDVLNILHRRYHTQSTPMSRATNDTASLALAIEGGGMRGAISGGMAAAIACLGLSNAFDSIYGSSAGSIIGSYFVSRQLYLDVYTDVIPAGANLFVSKTKIIGDIFRNMFYIMKGPLGKRLNGNLIERFRNPTTTATALGTNNTLTDNLPPTRAGGLNISFVLDSIMCPKNGLRPLDLEAFAHNDCIQPLKIVSSSVELETGKLKSISFGSEQGHFRDTFSTNPSAGDKSSSSSAAAGSEYLYPEVESAELDEDGLRRGFWACLGASMSVPGAAGSPFRMDLPHSETNEPTPHLCFDAFCYEPVPFRSAVAEGATHVVALRSRPAGYEPKTKPTLYERAVAPLYFRSNGVNPSASEFFERGGQQYLYAEDVLLCDAGLNSTEAIPIPPTTPIYAGPETPTPADIDRKNWAKAHLYPITVPADVPELAVLSQDREDILEGIRHGFAAAYDALAPVVGLEVGPNSLDGMQVAKLVFPDPDEIVDKIERQETDELVLATVLPLEGEKLGQSSKAASENEIVSATAESQDSDTDDTSTPRRRRFRRLLSKRRKFQFRFRRGFRRRAVEKEAEEIPAVNEDDALNLPTEADHLLSSFLPGVALGGLPLVAERVQTYLESINFLNEDTQL